MRKKKGGLFFHSVQCLYNDAEASGQQVQDSLIVCFSFTQAFIVLHNSICPFQLMVSHLFSYFITS